jgi:hypothetical protein
MEQKQVFGLSTESFNIEKLANLCETGTEEDIKKYISTYFAKLIDSRLIIFWDHEEQRIEFYSDETMKNRVLTKDVVIFHKRNKWVTRDWFFGIQNPSYHPVCAPGKPLIYKTSTSKLCINIVPPLLHIGKPRKKLEEYPIEVQNKVNTVWDHIRIVWAGRDEELFKYNQLWIAHMVAGRKMRSCIINKSIEGVGKSIMIEFLKHKVLGKGLVLHTSDVNIFTGHFNAILVGKILVVLEEAPCATSGEWHVMDSKLKNLITESEITIRAMHKDHRQMPNSASIILNTNKEVIHMNCDSRRYIVNDVSFEMKGNKQYFYTLYEAINYELVGEAFYFHCLDIAEQNPKFDEQEDKPITKSFIRNVSDNAPPLYRYIKEKYILNKRGIDMKYKDFYDKFAEWCQQEKINYYPKKNDCIIKLKEIGINYIYYSTKHNNCNWIQNSFEELKKIFDEKYLIGEADEIIENAIEKHDDYEFDDDDEIKQQSQTTVQQTCLQNPSDTNIQSNKNDQITTVQQTCLQNLSDTNIQSNDNDQITNNIQSKPHKYNLDKFQKLHYDLLRNTDDSFMRMIAELKNFKQKDLKLITFIQTVRKLNIQHNNNAYKIVTYVLDGIDD